MTDRAMTSADASSAEPAELIAAEARRRRPFRWAMLIAVSWLLAMVIVRLVWGYVADRRLRAEIDRIRAAGEPILVQDFIPTVSVPDEANAALLYMQATQALVRKDGTTVSFSDFTTDTRFVAAYPDDARLIVEANALALDLLRQGRDLPEADWGVRLTSPMLNVVLSHLSSQREVAKFAIAAAVFQHHEGNSAQAVETLRDLLALAYKLGDERSTTLITHLVSISIDSLVVSAIEMITPTLQTGGARHGGEPQVSPADRQQVEAFISLLLDEAAMRRSLRSGLYAERAMQLDSVDQYFLASVIGPSAFGGGGLSVQFAPMQWCMSPLYKLEALRLLRQTTQRMQACLVSDWGEARRIITLTEAPAASNRLNSLTHSVSNILAPSLNRFMALQFRTLALRRMAALALAIRLYQLDNGRRPERLEQLVPHYVDILPPDPFAADGHTFGYLPDAKPPILYSIGDDGQNDGGAYILTSLGGVDREQQDMPFFLDGDRPRPPLKQWFPPKASP